MVLIRRSLRVSRSARSHGRLRQLDKRCAVAWAGCGWYMGRSVRPRTKDTKQDEMVWTYRISHAQKAICLNDALRHNSLRLRNSNRRRHGHGHRRLRNSGNGLRVLRVLLNVLRRDRDGSRLLLLLLLLNRLLLGASHDDSGDDIGDKGLCCYLSFWCLFT